jgi:NADH dehydrogenase
MRVVILGAGFGGLWAAKTLAHTSANVTLVDHQNYHVFIPLLYQVAAAELEPEEIAYPLRNIFRKVSNIRFAMANATNIDLTRRAVVASGQEIPYDFLILAIGSASNFFGVPGADDFAFPLKTLEQGASLRNQILKCFERAELELDSKRRQQLLTFAVVGGGRTGVEFAGALVELIRGPLQKDYRNIDFREPRVMLCHSGDRLIPDLPEPLSHYALERLRKMGVEVRLGSRVSRVTAEAVYHQENEAFPTTTVVWTAGVRGKPDIEGWGLPTTKSGQIPVLPTLQVPEHPEIYAIGDIAYLEEGGHPLPMAATVAIQEGVSAARNVRLQMEGRPPTAFHYRDPGSMATVGRNAAVARIHGFALKGFPAWILWLLVHLFKLIGFRNRLFVMANWAFDYFFYERAVRLILPNEPQERCCRELDDLSRINREGEGPLCLAAVRRLKTFE